MFMELPGFIFASLSWSRMYRKKAEGLLNTIQLSLSPFSAEFTSKTTFVSRFLVNLVGRRKITPKLNTGREREEI